MQWCWCGGAAASPRRALLLPLALWLGQVAALRLARQAVTADESSFVSNDGLVCAQAASRTAEGALAVRKAGPRGLLYNTTQAANTSCEALGYRLAAGNDSCYPGVQLFVRAEEDRPEVEAADAAALRGFAARYSLDVEQVALLAACACHPQSSAARAAKSRCPELDAVPGAWVHHDPSDGRELMCDEGPLLDATLALATLKSSAQLSMHQHDQVAAATCRSLGFRELFPPDDHCFPRMHLWTRRGLDVDEGVDTAQRIEGELFGGGFQRWAEARGLNTWILTGVPGCHCQPGSSVRAGLGKVCEYPELRPPIADWWQA